MTFLDWNRRAASLVATLLAVGLVSACTDPETNAGQNARADIKVTLSQGLAASDVTRISVSVQGPGIPTPITTELTKNGTAWEGTLQNIPEGTDRFFIATAHDASGAVIYKGQAGPITIDRGSAASVVIVLQQTHPPAPFENVAPIIESLVASSNPVQPGSTLTLTSRAFDPNPSDTLSYTWSASAGSFGSPTAASTSWTAPATEGTQRVILEVKDSRGASTTMSLDIVVQSGRSVGSAHVSTSFNTWPSISTMTGYPSPLVPGSATKLFVSASDADGDFLTYAWSTSCPGGFDNPNSPQPSFTLSEPASDSSCSLRVLISDGRGGQQSGSLTLHVRGTTPPPNQPPMILRVYGSSPQAGGGELITLGVHAQDPEGLPLYFNWSPSQGLIRADRSTATSSEIDWQAPTCFDAPVSINVHINDPAGLATSHVFFISPRPGTECSSMNVTGSRTVTYVVDDNNRHVIPDDLSTLDIGAWVPTVDGTGFEYRAGTGRNDGTFYIPDVQRTPYFLQLGTSYQWTTDRKPVLSRTQLGRPYLEPLPQGLFLDLQLTGLTPWRADNDLQFHAPAVGLGFFSTICASPAFPAQEGNAFISGPLEYAESLETCGNTVGRLDPTRGDLFYVTHLESRVAPGSDALIQEVRQALVAKTLPETSPGTFQLSGTMTPVSLVRQPVDFRITDFEVQALAAHPAAKLTTNNLHIGTLQGYKEFGTYIGWPDLALASDNTPGQGDSLMTFEYGDPYPTTWSRFVTASASATVSYTATLPDGTASDPRTITVNATSRAPLRSGVTQLVRPQMGPPRDLKLNGQPATTNLPGVGPSPLVSWTAPALGVPTRYSVRLYRFTATSTGGTSRVQVATFNTTEPQFRLPPNLLVAGPTYALQVYAYSELNGGATSHYASAVTSGFKP
jgi:hypothetical protein